MNSNFGKSIAAIGQRLVTFFRENRGSVSVEFAFIMPLLITLWLGTMEISEGIEVNKKIGRSASTIGDLITREDKVDEAKLQDIMDIGDSQLLPYGRSTAKYTVVGVAIDSSGVAKVAWSMEKYGTQFKVPLKVGDPYPSVPAKIKIPSTFVVEVTSRLEFLPITSWSIQKNKGSGDSAYAAVDMKETYYLRPRQKDENFECTDCSANPKSF